MPQRPKSPLEESSRSGNRYDAVTMPADSPGFSIETTTMRLKSLKLRRAEVADRQISDAIKPAKSQDPMNMPGGGPAQRAGITSSPTRERGSVLDQLAGMKR